MKAETTLRRRQEEMRARQVAERKRKQAEHVIAINPYRETILRNREAAKNAKQIAREIEREHRQREKPGFKKIDNYLYRSERRLREERRITAFYGCKTSWPRILDHAKYCNTPAYES